MRGIGKKVKEVTQLGSRRYEERLHFALIIAWVTKDTDCVGPTINVRRSGCIHSLTKQHILGI